MRKVLVAITTGRPIYRETLAMLAASFAEHRSFEQYQIDILINYDPSYLKLPSSTFVYDAKDSATFNKLLYLGPESVPGFRTEMKLHGLKEEVINLLCQSEGFGNKKNLILWSALKGEYDVLLFWDDDEYPIVLMQEGKRAVWRTTDILGAHMGSANDECDVATGFWTGHVFPIYPPLVQKLRVSAAVKLGEALGLGTETHSAESFANLSKSFEVGREIPAHREIHESRGGKWVSGGNLSLRMGKVIDGSIPPFYTPRDSRGDDTVFSMGLSMAKVLLVSGGAFHDMYLEYPEITRGIYPAVVDYRPANNDRYLIRFASALKAWLAYAPLFVRIRNGHRHKYVISEMENLLAEVDASLFVDVPELAVALEGQQLAPLLRRYGKLAEQQFEELHICYEAWAKVCSRMG